MPKNRQSLTKQWIENLKPPEIGQRVSYFDSKVGGLELCVTPTGVKTFSVLKWIDGRTRRVVLGRYDGNAKQGYEFDQDPLSVLGNNAGLTVEQARQLAIAVIAQLQSGQAPQQLRRQNADKITLGELFREYMDKYAMEHCKTWRQMENAFRAYLSHWERTPVGQIKRAEVQMLINKLGKENGKATANRTLELIRAIINKGKQWSFVSGENPATGVTKYKLKPRERFVYEEELPRLIAAIEAEENEDIRDYVLISLYTGARKSNVLSMRWEYVNLDSATWTIPDTKNDTSQVILLTGPELAILKRRFDARKSEKDFEFVFPGKGGAKHLVEPKKGWQRILNAANIRDLHLHDLRRTLGSYMAMTGTSLSVIGNALNHKDVSTTRKVYAHSAREAERKAREIAHDRMFAKKADESNVVKMPVSSVTEF
jgi:integrase